ILNDLSVARLIQEEGTILSPKDQDGLKDAVLQGGRHLLALALLSGEPFSVLWNLMKEGQIDGSRILSEKECRDLFPERANYWFTRQWKFQPAVFSSDMEHVDFAKSTILPYESNTLFAEGNYSDVFQVVVDASEHEIHDEQLEDMVCYIKVASS